MLELSSAVAKGIRRLSEFAALRNLLKTLDTDRYLANSDRFRERAEALDLLDAFDLDSKASLGEPEPGHVALYRRAQDLQTELEAANIRLYESIRNSIRSGDGRNALLRCVGEAPGETMGQSDAPPKGDSYDCLDELISGVFGFVAPEAPEIDLSSEMVAYQPTPARHVFEFIRRAKLAAKDVFIDLGSGLGHLPLLIATCTSACAIGIELEPAYVDCARQSAKELQLPNATFLGSDAREADLSSGTVFYLYTPFRGAILRTVLDRLRAEANTRAIRVCTFGPCTPTIAAESWLALDPTESGYVSVFRSLG
jgi:phosphoribosylcarboxyaminoimidazole (NCAIR) mutase